MSADICFDKTTRSRRAVSSHYGERDSFLPNKSHLNTTTNGFGIISNAAGDENRAEQNSYTANGRRRANSKLPSFQPLASLAEENLVKNFNKLNAASKINEVYLQTNKPQRIELPLFFNTPVRSNDNDLKTMINKRARPVSTSFCDTSMYESAVQTRPDSSKPQGLGISNLNYSFNKFGQFALAHNTSNVSDPVAQDEVSKQKIADKHVMLRSLRRRKDYEMLAFACKRAGKHRDEGRSYYSIGVLNDNIGKYKLAIQSYEKFLNICQSISDHHGEALAYNCLGVDHQMLGQNSGEPAYYEQAIKYHKLHESIADSNGKFLACINLGLCYDATGMKKQALSYYQQALRHSVKMSNLASQTIAIGNIGRIGMPGLLDNKEKMAVFIDKYIKLTQDMKDDNGELKAQLKMGQVTSLIGNFETGRDSFLRALQLAEQRQENDRLQQAKCGFAVANAELQMNHHLMAYASRMASALDSATEISSHNSL